MSGLAFPKPSRTARKKAERETKLAREKHESTNKQLVRVRDLRRCRFPLCGCKKLGLRLEVSHVRHKGMGGNPEGDRSLMPGMILFCVHRHQDGVFSRGKGTLRTFSLTGSGHNGPVAFEIDADTVMRILAPAWEEDFVLRAVAAGKCQDGWIEIARERSIHELEPRLMWQQMILDTLAEMDL